MCVTYIATLLIIKLTTQNLYILIINDTAFTTHILTSNRTNKNSWTTMPIKETDGEIEPVVGKGPAQERQF